MKKTGRCWRSRPAAVVVARGILDFAGEISFAGPNSAIPQLFSAYVYYRCLPALRTVRYLAVEGEIEVEIAKKAAALTARR